MKIDWSNLGFSYHDAKAFICYTWRQGAWDNGEMRTDPHFNIHIAATALHYGQSAFEGLKAFACRDGKVRVFRAEENARRMQRTARRILMPEVPTAMFENAVQRIVRENLEYVPPYGSGGALYIRPLLFGCGPRIGVNPADEYVFLILVVPVGDYYKGGLQPVSAVVVEEYDRTAPHGLGNVKVAGNYAASLEPSKVAHDMGYPINLYLDPKEHRYIDEFGTSNFIAITKNRQYLTPDSPSVLPSVTNKTLMTLAQEDGMEVIARPITFDEIPGFAEVGACGTAVVITPVNRIVRGNTVIDVGPRNGCGPELQKLYTTVRAIQTGDLPDRYGWTKLVE